MKLDQTTTKIIKTENFEESYFGIDSQEDLVHIFDILRNKIYKDKILAVIREYSTNAYDAHIQCGTPDKPIVVSLPTRILPEFSVRDYGHGLTEEEVRSIYVKYGRSTKRDSNDYNGQLGLGCKAGFSYGNSFIITSYQKGTEKTFEAYIDETKIGKIAKLTEKETSEPDGVKVTIQVKTSDTHSFQNTAQLFYQTFQPLPEIHRPEVRFVPEERILETDDFYLGPRYDRPSVLMGNIKYVLDMGLVRHNTPPEEYKKIHAMSHSSIVLKFKIGDVSIASSRESLEYDKKTLKKILESLRLARIESEKRIRESIKQAKNIFEAHLRYQSYNIHNSSRIILDEMDVYYKQKELDNSGFGITTKYKLIAYTEHLPNNNANLYPRQLRKSQNSQMWKHDSGILYVVKDTSDKINQRINNIFKTNTNISKVFLFDNASSTTELWNEWLETQGIEESDFLKLSTIDPLPVKRIPNPVNVLQKAKIFNFDICNLNSDDDHSWKPVSIDLDSSTGTYVTIDRFSPYLNGSKQSDRTFFIFLSQASKVLKKNYFQDLAGVKKSTVPLFEKHKNFSPIENVVRKDLINSFEANDRFMAKLKFSVDEYYIQNRLDIFVKKQLNIKDLSSTAYKLQKAYADSLLTCAEESLYREYAALADNLGMNLKSTILPNDKNQPHLLYKQFEETYPMLKYMDRNSSSQECENYINLINTGIKNGY